MTVYDQATESCAPMTARDVCQLLRDVIFDRRSITRCASATWDEMHSGQFQVDIDGWRVEFQADCGELQHCVHCISPDDRNWSLDCGDRFGTDPVALLSTWEHATLLRRLEAL